MHVHMHAWYEHHSVHMHMEAREQFDGVGFLGLGDQTQLSGLVQNPSPSEPPLWQDLAKPSVGLSDLS